MDAATKVRPTPSGIMEDYIWTERESWHLCRIKQYAESVRRSVQPLLVFDTGSIFNDVYGDYCWKQTR